MRNLLLLVAVLAAIQHWDSLTGFFRESPQVARATDAKVILYSTQWCGYCRQARDLLRSQRVAFFEYDIEQSQEGRRQYEALGGRGVPLLVIGDRVIRGYSRQGILAAL